MVYKSNLHIVLSTLDIELLDSNTIIHNYLSMSPIIELKKIVIRPHVLSVVLQYATEYIELIFVKAYLTTNNVLNKNQKQLKHLEE